MHRPRYDDWSFPKGKLDAGETFEAAAVREVEEETGLRGVLGHELPEARYTDGKGRPKVVRYWEMAVAEDTGWEPGDEVDVLRGCPSTPPSSSCPTATTSRSSTPSPASPGPADRSPGERQVNGECWQLVHLPVHPAHPCGTTRSP